MKIRTINYQKVFPIAQYVNERIGVDIELEEGESEDEAFRMAKETVERWHKEGNPLLYMNFHYPSAGNQTGWQQPINEASPVPAQTPVIQVQKTEHVSKTIEEMILSCQEVKVLESYKLIVKSNADLQKLYDLRMDALTQTSSTK